MPFICSKEILRRIRHGKVCFTFNIKICSFEKRKRKLWDFRKGVCGAQKQITLDIEPIMLFIRSIYPQISDYVAC